MQFSCPIDLEILSTPEGIGFYNSAKGERWLWEAAPRPEVILLLRDLSSPKSSDELKSIASKYFPNSPNEIIAALKESGLLIENDHSQSISNHPWCNSGWSEAARLHTHIRSLISLDYSSPKGYTEDFKDMATKVAVEPAPEKFKKYDTAKKVELSRGKSNLGRNHFSNEGDPINIWNIDYLSDFLRLVVGVTGFKTLAATGKHITKTSPSGGARHPTEAYLFISNVAGVDPAIYHYNVAEHSLGQIGIYMDMEKFIRRNIVVMPGRGPENISFSMVYSTIFERSMHRYRDPRSYRVMHLDIGHIFGTAHALLDSINSPYFSGYAVRENELLDVLDLPNWMETPMAHTTVGNRSL